MTTDISRQIDIYYVETADAVRPDHLQGFFVGWPNPPSSETHLALLRASDAVVLAVDGQTRQVVGFITALSDGILSAYIPLLEVLPTYQNQGVGRALVSILLSRLSRLYMVDILCDPDLMPFYAHFGFQHATGMTMRRYHQQSGNAHPLKETPL